MQNAEPVAAAVTATVSAAGTISALTIANGGSGYIGSAVTVSIARPVGSAVTFNGGVGVYTGIATATVPVVNCLSHSSTVCLCSRARSPVLEAGDLVDVFRQQHEGQRGLYSFWTYMGNCRSKNVGWRLDYTLVGPR